MRDSAPGEGPASRADATTLIYPPDRPILAAQRPLEEE